MPREPTSKRHGGRRTNIHVYHEILLSILILYCIVDYCIKRQTASKGTERYSHDLPLACKTTVVLVVVPSFPSTTTNKVDTLCSFRGRQPGIVGRRTTSLIRQHTAHRTRQSCSPATPRTCCLWVYNYDTKYSIRLNNYRKATYKSGAQYSSQAYLKRWEGDSQSTKGTDVFFAFALEHASTNKPIISCYRVVRHLRILQ